MNKPNYAFKLSGNRVHAIDARDATASRLRAYRNDNRATVTMLGRHSFRVDFLDCALFVIISRTDDMQIINSMG